MPGGLTAIGGALVAASGVVSIGIAVPIGAVFYEVDPNGLFGHIGILAGAVAIVIGAFLWWFGRHTPRDTSPTGQTRLVEWCIILGLNWNTHKGCYEDEKDWHHNLRPL
jgi:hypothetical protein